MARVLLAWELGGDLGHVMRLAPIARHLRAMGHEAAVALADLRGGFGYLGGSTLFQSPLLALPATPNPSPLNASDILLNSGYADAASLAGALRAWTGLLDLWNPGVVVCDFAPTAQLAARAHGLACVSIGSGFSLPPPGDPLPKLRDWVDTDAKVLAALDARLVATVSEAFEQLRLGPAQPRTAREVFAADAELLCTFAEIDPFGPRPGASYLGPVADVGASNSVDWNEGAGPRVFAYLKPDDPRFLPLIRALDAVAGQAIVAAPNLLPRDAEALSTSTLRIVPRALDLDHILAGADLCVCHSGPGTVARALIAGVPLGLLPQQLEQFLVARRATATGMAQHLSPEDPPPDFFAWIAGLLASEDLRLAAQRSAQACRDHRADDAAAQVARRVAGMARS